ncbi:MAG TPA: RHS repeat-associated core domain-containing protein [Stenotrophomonas sp.]|jgi:RHS repeat-associated protein
MRASLEDWRNGWVEIEIGLSVQDIDQLQDPQGIENPYQYTGRERDRSGLYYYRARYYNQKMGRFIGEDPLGITDGSNAYAYVRGNPVSGNDPLGLLTLIYHHASGRLTAVNQGKSYVVNATSGRQDCPGCDSSVRNKGPIPTGDYRVYGRELSNPGFVRDLLRNTQGDWGDWRVQLWPDDQSMVHGRSGFFLHGGTLPGSAGCFDIGGGVNGDAITDRLLNDIINDPDGVIPARVR